jgi:class 3 adenylate cyclase
LPCPLGPSTTLCSKLGELSLALEQRILAAILAADVVGYSRLMGRDESGTLARLATISSRTVAADLGERQRLHRRVHPLPSCPSYTALANAR